MPLASIQPSFSSGEVSPALYSRVDLSKYGTALKTCRNFIIHPQGGASNRPGTRYVASTKYSNRKAVLKKFIFAQDETYVLEFGDGYVRFFNNDEQIKNSGIPYEIESPYLENDLHLIRVEGSADVIYITHPDYQQRTLSRYGNSDWRFEVIEPDNGPFMPQNSDEGLSLNVSAISGTGITLNASSSSTTTKALIHFDGSDTSLNFTEDNGKTITNTATYDSYTKLMLHLDGINNGTTFTDEIGKTVTRVGSVVTKTDNKKFGSASAYFNATGDYLTLDDSDDWNFGTGNFTIDCWVKLETAGTQYIYYQGADDNNNIQLTLDCSSTQIAPRFSIRSASVTLINTGYVYTTLDVTAWHHYAVVRYGNIFTVYVDGVSVSTQTVSLTAPDLASLLYIGNERGTGYNLKGWVDEFRVSKGSARWTSEFTPLSYQYGFVKITTAQSKFGGSSAKFDGDSFLSLADSADWNFGAGDLTIEMQVNRSLTSDCYLLSQYADASNNIFIESSGTTLNFSSITAGTVDVRFNVPYVPSGSWEHLMITRNGDTWHVFKDGTELTKTLTHGAYACTLPDVSAPLRIGCLDGSSGFFAGYIDEFRILKGEAAHTTDFTAPSAEYIADGTFYPQHVGALFKLIHYVEGQKVTTAFGSSTTSTTIKCFSTWRLISHGTWTGAFSVEKSSDGGTTWTEIRSFSSANDYNADTSGTEDIFANPDPFLVRVNMYSYSSGTANIDLTTDPFYQHGIVRATAYVGPKQLTVDVIKEIGSTDETIDWAEGSWSDYRGWPSVCRFYKDRLCYSSTYSQPMTTWISEVSLYDSFLINQDVLDSDAISVNLPSRQLNAINGLIALKRLVAFTSSSEWTIGGTSDGILTSATVNQNSEGYRGSYGIEPVMVGEECLFLTYSGRGVRNLEYQLAYDSLRGANLNVMAEHLFFNHTILEMDYQQEPDSLVWCLRDDGIMPAMTYMPEQEVVGWHWHDTEGKIESFCVIPKDGSNQIWMIVNRDNGRFVEFMEQRLASTDISDQIFLDSCVTYDGAATVNFAGLGHLEGMSVGVLADGVVIANGYSPMTVAGSQLTLNQAASTVVIGLPYYADLETLNIEVASQQGTLQGKKVKVGAVTFRVSNTRGGYVGPDSAHLYEAFPSLIDTKLAEQGLDPDSLFTGDLRVQTGAGYSEGGRVFYRQYDPLPITIGAVVPEIIVGTT